jgi:hypothetical protein
MLWIVRTTFVKATTNQTKMNPTSVAEKATGKKPRADFGDECRFYRSIAQA